MFSFFTPPFDPGEESHPSSGPDDRQQRQPSGMMAGWFGSGAVQVAGVGIAPRVARRMLYASRRGTIADTVRIPSDAGRRTW